MKILGNKLISECTEYDFKQELERKKISHWLKSVSAYANSEGGALYYGVDNDGIVTGLANPQSDSDFISQKINAHLDPVPDWTLTPGEDEHGHKVLEVLVKPGQFTPYYLVLDGSRQAYVRSGNESVVASSRELLKLVLKGTNSSWDALPSRETVETTWKRYGQRMIRYAKSRPASLVGYLTADFKLTEAQAREYFGGVG